MTISVLKSKLHRIRVSEACLDYEGSLTIDADYMDAVGIVPYERILCADVENGNRFETYAISGARGLRAILEELMTDLMFEVGASTKPDGPAAPASLRSLRLTGELVRARLDGKADLAASLA